jgi:hypothetical protein
MYVHVMFVCTYFVPIYSIIRSQDTVQEWAGQIAAAALAQFRLAMSGEAGEGDALFWDRVALHRYVCVC